ncbi:MAG: hypothetical protein HOP15_08625 [Planctomycetes bacterium]|nr:hypothetical protein [Planctomycetota bacterium]
MSAPLELDLERPSQPTPRAPWARVRAGGRGALLWAPVWVPLVFLGQLLVLGLRPTLAEENRLERAEAEVHARAAALRDEELGLAEEARMLADDVFRERVRRSLVDPAAEPLTLERARAGAGQ